MKTSIFVVEDNSMYSMFVQLKLDEMFNYTTHFFPSAEEALVNMHLKPDIIVLDYMLDGMNGLEALKKFKAESPKAKVIMVSAQLNPEVTQQLLDAGAYTYIQKDKTAPQRIIDTIDNITAA
ncbi:MAG TPA: response regulator [Bacteroidia bacterium]